MPQTVIPDETAGTAGGSPDRSSPRSRWRYAPWLAMAAVLGGSIYQLRSQGRLWWCACGQPSLWSGNTWSRHNSQHLVDPYSFTHMLHGMALWGVLVSLCPRVPAAWRLWLAVSVEAVWEVVETTDVVIQSSRWGRTAPRHTRPALASFKARQFPPPWNGLTCTDVCRTVWDQ